MPAAPPVAPPALPGVWLGAVLLPAPPDGVIVLPAPGEPVPLAEGRLAPAPPPDPVFELLDPELSQAAKANAERSAAAISQLFLSIICLHSLELLEMAKFLPDIAPDQSMPANNRAGEEKIPVSIFT